MKKTVYKIGKFLYFFSLVNILYTKVVYAYIDPSTVTYLVQAIAGILIAIGAAFTVYRHKIIAFFKGKKNPEEKSFQSTKQKELADEDGVVDIKIDEE